MKRTGCIIISLLALVLLSLSASASEPWTFYDPDAAPAVVPSLYRARINEDYSISVTFSVLNAGETKAENFSITRASVTFGAYTFDLPDQVRGKSIKAGKSRKYTVKIPSESVPEALTEADLSVCKYVIEYSYAAGSCWHEVTTSASTDAVMRR